MAGTNMFNVWFESVNYGRCYTYIHSYFYLCISLDSGHKLLDDVEIGDYSVGSIVNHVNECLSNRECKGYD